MELPSAILLQVVPPTSAAMPIIKNKLGQFIITKRKKYKRNGSLQKYLDDEVEQRKTKKQKLSSQSSSLWEPPHSLEECTKEKRSIRRALNEVLSPFQMPQPTKFAPISENPPTITDLLNDEHKTDTELKAEKKEKTRMIMWTMRKAYGQIVKQKFLSTYRRATFCFEVMSGPFKWKKLKRRVDKLGKKAEMKQAEREFLEMVDSGLEGLTFN